MKISSVGYVKQNYTLNFTNNELKNNQQQLQTYNYSTNPIEEFSEDINSLLFINETQKTKKTREDRRVLSRLSSRFTRQAEQIYELGAQIAKMSHSREVETWHYYLASLMTLRNYMSQVEEGLVNPIEETLYATVSVFPMLIHPGCDVWTNSSYRKESMEIIDKHIAIMMNDFVQAEQAKYPRTKLSYLSPSADTIKDMQMVYKRTEDLDHPTEDFTDDCWLSMPVYSSDKRIKDEIVSFITDLQIAAMVDQPDENDRHHIEFYDKKADSIWKNISHGNNVLVLSNSENEQSNEYLKNAFVNLINKPGNKYGSIDPKKTKVVMLNNKAILNFIADYVNEITLDKTQKDKLTVFVANLDSLLKNNGNILATPMIKMLYGLNPQDDSSNVKFVFTVSPNVYHANTANPNMPLARVLQTYAMQTLPILNAVDARQYLTNESGIEFIKAQIGKEIDEEAVYHAIELTSTKNGNYPEKAINLLNAVAKFFVEEEKIKAQHVDDYLKETESLSEVSDTSEKMIIFDTGKTIEDIKGMPMVKAEAKSIVKQIKNGTIGTRGYVISHSHGSSYGGGRRHFVEAIAGEADIPMLVINAKDFALKDIDALSQSANLSEIKIKNIFQIARAQAEANKLNTVMVYIENFDNFASDPLYGISSIYEQKAFTQILSEMEAIRKEGKINVVVMGSMNMPQVLDENILKPYKFLNQISIYQPYDAKQRKEIIDYYVDKNNYQIAGETKADKEKVIKNISESTMGFSVVDLIYLLENAQIISKERDKNAIDSSDLIESLLQIYSGRTNTFETTDVTKQITTAHEAGHALTSLIMYNLMSANPWNTPYKMDYMTLDPRGNYGGMVSFKDPDNIEISFERVISEIVVDYGGYSSENHFYGMRGSMGIRQDMKNAESYAIEAVREMGMGYRTGVRRISDSSYLSERQKENIALDVEDILKTARKISDLIIKEHSDFIEQFTQKHYSQVSTGECIIPAEDFQKELEEWRKENPIREYKTKILVGEINKLIEDCKNGKVE